MKLKLPTKQTKYRRVHTTAGLFAMFWPSYLSGNTSIVGQNLLFFFFLADVIFATHESGERRRSSAPKTAHMPPAEQKNLFPLLSLPVSLALRTHN